MWILWHSGLNSDRQGLIADGIHVDPVTLRVALAAKPDRIFLVSDCMALAGTDLTEFTLGGRRILRREQLFSVVRESMIRGGVLSSSYEFKVLTLDANGDSFLVLIDLALPADVMPDEYLLEIERWIQSSADKRHTMAVQGVYWRRKAVHDQVGMALKAAVAAQTRREAVPMTAEAVPAPTASRPMPIPSPTATTVTSNLNPAIVGTSITFTATVSGGTPAGNVTFYDGPTVIGTRAVSAATSPLPMMSWRL